MATDIIVAILALLIDVWKLAIRAIDIIVDIALGHVEIPPFHLAYAA